MSDAVRFNGERGPELPRSGPLEARGGRAVGREVVVLDFAAIVLRL